MSNCIIDNLDNFKKLSPQAQHIAQHDVSAKHAGDVFNNLSTDAIASGATNSDEFIEYLRPFEEEILDIRHANGENVKTKKGKYLYTKVSQNSTYRSNKSVICKSLDAGVPLLDENGNYIGKTALEKARKTKATTIMQPIDRAKRAVTMLSKAWPELTNGEKEHIDSLLGEIPH